MDFMLSPRSWWETDILYFYKYKKNLLKIHIVKSRVGKQEHQNVY